MSEVVIGIIRILLITGVTVIAWHILWFMSSRTFGRAILVTFSCCWLVVMIVAALITFYPRTDGTFVDKMLMDARLLSGLKGVSALTDDELDRELAGRQVNDRGVTCAARGLHAGCIYR